MEISSIHGHLQHDQFFIYAAGDCLYFDQYGKTLIESINRNTDYPIHLHLFDPRDDQVQYCIDRGVSVTYEYISSRLFDRSLDAFRNDPFKLQKLVSDCAKLGIDSYDQYISKVYYTCVRFIRLAQIIKQTNSILIIDIDAIVREQFPLPRGRDFYIHKFEVFDRVLCGVMYITERGHSFYNYYTQLLLNSFVADDIHWAWDQKALWEAIKQFNQYGLLPESYIDWRFREDSYIWTAKGNRKGRKIFRKELQKYIS